MIILAILVLILFIQHISAWGCLIRPDYNFVFLIFAYFYLVSNKKNDAQMINVVIYMS